MSNQLSSPGSKAYSGCSRSLERSQDFIVMSVYPEKYRNRKIAATVLAASDTETDDYRAAPG
jgi:hypothetical protein